MSMKYKKIPSRKSVFILESVLAAFLLSECDNSSADVAKIQDDTPDTYPIQTDKTISYWMSLHGGAEEIYRCKQRGV